MKCNHCSEPTNPVDAPKGFCPSCVEWAEGTIKGIAQVIDAAAAKCNPCDPKRPYDGEAHTGQGVRGSFKISDLTIRDICDCFVLGWLDASGQGHLVVANACDYRDVYTDCDIDPLAVMQNMSCWIEKKLGVFPNIPTPEAQRD